jgi:hypothetical protein
LRRAFLWLVLGVTLAGLLAWTPLRGLLGRPPQAETPYSREHQRLLASLGATRPVVEHLPGGLSYGSYQPASQTKHSRKTVSTNAATRGDAAPVVGDASGVLSPRIALAIPKAAERNPSPENRAALAVLDLIDGRSEIAVHLLREIHTQKLIEAGGQNCGSVPICNDRYIPITKTPIIRFSRATILKMKRLLRSEVKRGVSDGGQGSLSL